MTLPIKRAIYKHKNNNEYYVMFIANADSQKEEYPPQVIYVDIEAGKVWAKGVERFNSGMTLIENHAPVQIGYHILQREGVEYPKVGYRYQHENGNEYTVLLIANTHAESDDYPVTIVYQGDNGKAWSKTLDNFNQKMKKVGL